MYAQTNAQFPNQIQLFCAPFVPPFLQNGPLGAFNPVRDLQVWVDGTLLPIQSWSFDAINNRYLLYMGQAIYLQGVIQIIHHVPSPPFMDTQFLQLFGFAIIAGYSTSVNTVVLPQMALIAVPPSIPSGSNTLLLWNTVGVSQIQITGNNGTDPVYEYPSSGLAYTLGVGTTITENFTENITLTMTGYDNFGNPIIGLAPLSVLVTVSSSGYFLLQETGLTNSFLLEDGSGAILLE